MGSKDAPPNSLRSNQRPLQFLFTGDQAIALTARILTRFIIQKFGLLLPSTDGRPWVTVVVPALEVEKAVYATLKEVPADARRDVAAGTLCLLDRLHGQFPEAGTRRPVELFFGAFMHAVRRLKALYGDAASDDLNPRRPSSLTFVPERAYCEVRALLGEGGGMFERGTLDDVWTVVSLQMDPQPLPSAAGKVEFVAPFPIPSAMAAASRMIPILCDKNVLRNGAA